MLPEPPAPTSVQVDDIVLLPSVRYTLVIATTQPSVRPPHRTTTTQLSPGDGDEDPNPPPPTSVQTDEIRDKEIDTVLRSVIEPDGSPPAPEPEPVIQQVVASVAMGDENTE